MFSSSDAILLKIRGEKTFRRRWNVDQFGRDRLSAWRGKILHDEAIGREDEFFFSFQYDKAALKFEKAKKAYDHSLPPGHPSRGLLRINLGNVYRANHRLEDAIKEYESGLEIQEKYLPADHSDIVRTLHNLSVTYADLGETQKAKEYFSRAEDIVQRTLTGKHPLTHIIARTKTNVMDDIIEIPDATPDAPPVVEVKEVVPSEPPPPPAAPELMEIAETGPEAEVFVKEKRRRRKKKRVNAEDHDPVIDAEESAWDVAVGNDGEEVFSRRF